ncbi:hypothetical protein PSTT_03535 [Puccinia striiformis]|uniref:Tet-like 2OG-Fe(II) oxygenase domain-containing protein n=1 Tax=Puccinia striiformis TaxID=27350 RepID=A0A2S4VVR6_9BASI|nr:hypothetical protein PSTT_03535 [Puccinia striiformis]
MGWRKEYETKRKLGITAIAAKVAQDRLGFLELFHEIPFLNDFLATQFRNVSQKMYDKVKAQHNPLNAPSLVPFFFADPNASCCHFLSTMDNFHNKPHQDTDSSPYSLVMWIPIDKKTGKLVEENFEVTGSDLFCLKTVVRLTFLDSMVLSNVLGKRLNTIITP